MNLTHSQLCHHRTNMAPRIPHGVHMNKSSLCYQMFVQIEIIDCEKKTPPRSIIIQPIDQILHVTEKTSQICSSLHEAPVERKGLPNSLVTQVCHQKTRIICTLLILTSCIAASFPNHFPKFLVLCLKLKVSLINVDDIPRALPSHPIGE
jgi:hypothetical protein